MCIQQIDTICFSKFNTVTMETVLFQVAENCENRENAKLIAFFMDLLQVCTLVKMIVNK